MKSKGIIFTLTVAACLCTVVLAVINASFGVMLTPMTEQLLPDTDASASQGYPNSAMQLGCIASVFALLFLGGKIKRSSALCFSAALISAAMLTLGTGPDFLIFTAVFFAVGIAFGAADVLSSALVADLYGAKATGMMCLLHACHGSAGMAAPVLLSAVLASGGKWSAPYTAIGILAGAVLLYLIAAFAVSERRSPRPQKRETGASRSSQPLRQRLFTGRLLSVFLPLLFYGIYLVGMICWTERYVGSVIGGSGGALSLTLLYVGLTACRLILPILHIAPRSYLRWSPILGAAVLVLGVLSHSEPVYLLCAGVSALIPGAFIPVAISAACAELPESSTLASTAANLFMLAGNSVSSPLIGAISGGAGLSLAMLLPAAALILAFACSFIFGGAPKETADAAI